jgi:RNA polymerase sigma-70 factor (ECF subfamily)
MIRRAEFPGAGKGRAWHLALHTGLFLAPVLTPRKARIVTDWSDCIRAIAETRDRAQFQTLFLHFAPRLKGFFLRTGAAPGLAEDLAQETMLAVWRKAGQFDPEKAQVSTWIFTIARNLRIDARRRERDPQAFAEFFENAPEPLPSEHLLSAERCEQVHRAMKILPPDQAEAIRLSFFEDKPHSEIATALGLPLGTVKSRVRLAMTRLRALVEDKQ